MNEQANRELKWVLLDNWSGLKASIKQDGKEFVTKRDFEIFKEKALKIAAFKIGVNYENIKFEADSENIYFTHVLNKTFKGKEMYNIDDPKLNKIKGLLLIPVIKKLDEKETVSPVVQQLILDFYSLSESDKKLFLSEIL